LPAAAAVTAISAGNLHTCAVADGIAYCWGSGAFGQLGNGTTGSQLRPVKVATNADSALPHGATVTAISTGNGHSCAVADAIAYCWGHGFNGQLGNGTTANQWRPVKVLSPS
jgi:alpha-tubulin suppressor-like RCC1 family protein